MPYLLVLGGEDTSFDKSLLFEGKIFVCVACIHHSGHATPRWGKLAVICHRFLQLVRKLELWKRVTASARDSSGALVEAECGKQMKRSRWGVGRGVWQDGADATVPLRAWACLDGTARPLPLFLRSCVTHCLPGCNFPSTVTARAHCHPGNF